jgi:hypothetical protein
MASRRGELVREWWRQRSLSLLLVDKVLPFRPLVSAWLPSELRADFDGWLCAAEPATEARMADAWRRRNNGRHLPASCRHRRVASSMRRVGRSLSVPTVERGGRVCYTSAAVGQYTFCPALPLAAYTPLSP